MDKQQVAIEIKTQPKEPASTPEPEQKELAEDPPQQKLSFFQRLFKRSKNECFRLHDNSAAA